VVALVVLFQRGDGQASQIGVDLRGKAAARGNGGQHGAQRGVLPHFHAALAGRAGEVCRAGADLDLVGRAAFFHLVHAEGALVDQADAHVLAAHPAQRQTDVAAFLGRPELAIVVVQRERQLVGLAPALFDQREFEQPRIDPVGQIGAIVEGEAQARLVRGHGQAFRLRVTLKSIWRGMPPAMIVWWVRSRPTIT
jgi:hypothetical protein